VFHNREYLVAVRALDGILALHTMRFADELVGADELEMPEPSRAPSRRELEMATSLVDSLHGAFEPDEYTDTYRERVLEMIARKAKGEEIETPAATDSEEPPDLMAALEASLSAAKDRSGSRSQSGARRSSSRRSASHKRTPRARGRSGSGGRR
jgi:DNA end-binding protein Ku